MRQPAWGRLGLLVWLVAAAVAAAEPPRTADASPLLPPGHWAVQAAQRLHDLGVVEPYLPAQNAVPRAAVRAALAQGAERAIAGRPEVAALAQAYLERFDEEFVSRPLVPGAFASLEHARLELALERTSSLFGSPLPSTPELRRLAPAEASVPLAGAGALHAQLSPYLGFSLEPAADRDGLHLPSWEAVVGLSPLTLSFGRTPVGYGLQGERSFVMSGAQGLLRLELATSRPFRLPGFLEHIGWIAFEGFVTRMSEARHPGAPVLWGANVRVQPHPRFELSLQRGVMVGEELGSEGSQASRLLKMIFATKNQRENNVAALSGRWRLPTERLLPLTAYAEWGADDLGAQFKAPGILVGLRAPSIPRLPAVSLGAEFSFLGALCCRTFQWYAHFLQTGGWVAQDSPLGHPLGGDGREYRLFGAADLLQSRLRLKADVFLRQRFPVNLYSPYREGTGVGMSASLAWRFMGLGELGLQASQEGGRSWRAGELQGRAALFF